MSAFFVKAGGAYGAATAVFVKKGGVYVDAAGEMKIKTGGLYIDFNVISPAPPTNLVPPVIAGTTTLSVTPGLWQGMPIPTLSYKWLRDGLEIPGETGLNYIVQPADQGHDISVSERGINDNGAATALSNVISIPAGGFSSGFDGGFN